MKKATVMWRCEQCDTQFREDAALKAPHPFVGDDEISFCPICKNPNCFVLVCDEEGCERDVSCGYPSPDGYRRVCRDHFPKQVNK